MVSPTHVSCARRGCGQTRATHTTHLKPCMYMAMRQAPAWMATIETPAGDGGASMNGSCMLVPGSWGWIAYAKSEQLRAPVNQLQHAPTGCVLRCPMRVARRGEHDPAPAPALPAAGQEHSLPASPEGSLQRLGATLAPHTPYRSESLCGQAWENGYMTSVAGARFRGGHRLSALWNGRA